MMLFPEAKVIFIHNPKTAGSAIVNALDVPGNRFYLFDTLTRDYDLRHLTLAQIKTLCPRTWQFITSDEVFSFAIVRHPVERAISAYFFCLKMFGVEIEFVDYLKAVHELGKWDHRLVHAIPQREFIYVDDQAIVKNVIQFEKLQESIPSLRDQLKKRSIQLGSLPRVNVGMRPAKINVTSQAREYLKRLYLEDCSRFGYFMDDPVES